MKKFYSRPILKGVPDKKFIQLTDLVSVKKLSVTAREDKMAYDLKISPVSYRFLAAE